WGAAGGAAGGARAAGPGRWCRAPPPLRERGQQVELAVARPRRQGSCEYSPEADGSMPWYSSWRLQGSIVIVWSALVRTSSPWLMSCVQAQPSWKETLLLRANGLSSVAASGCHWPVRPSAVYERYQR